MLADVVYAKHARRAVLFRAIILQRVSRALKLVDAGVVAPFQYTLLPWAILLGWLFFADLPRSNMLLGAAIIVSAGLYIFVRERRQATRPA